MTTPANSSSKWKNFLKSFSKVETFLCSSILLQVKLGLVILEKQQCCFHFERGNKFGPQFVPIAK